MVQKIEISRQDPQPTLEKLDLENNSGMDELNSLLENIENESSYVKKEEMMQAFFATLVKNGIILQQPRKNSTAEDSIVVSLSGIPTALLSEKTNNTEVHEELMKLLTTAYQKKIVTPPTEQGTAKSMITSKNTFSWVDSAEYKAANTKRINELASLAVLQNIGSTHQLIPSTPSKSAKITPENLSSALGKNPVANSINQATQRLGDNKEAVNQFIDTINAQHDLETRSHAAFAELARDTTTLPAGVEFDRQMGGFEKLGGLFQGLEKGYMSSMLGPVLTVGFGAWTLLSTLLGKGFSKGGALGTLFAGLPFLYKHFSGKGPMSDIMGETQGGDAQDAFIKEYYTWVKKVSSPEALKLITESLAANSEQNTTHFADELALVSQELTANELLTITKVNHTHGKRDISVASEYSEYSDQLGENTIKGLEKLKVKSSYMHNALDTVYALLGTKYASAIYQKYPNLNPSSPSFDGNGGTARYLGYLVVRDMYTTKTNNKSFSSLLAPKSSLYSMILTLLGPDGGPDSNHSLRQELLAKDKKALSSINSETISALEKETGSQLHSLNNAIQKKTPPMASKSFSSAKKSTPSASPTASPDDSTIPSPIHNDITPPNPSKYLEQYLATYKPYADADLQPYLEPYYKVDATTGEKTPYLKNGVHIMQIGYLDTVANEVYRALVEKSSTRGASILSRKLAVDDVRQLIFISENPKIHQEPISKERLYATVLEKLRNNTAYTLPGKEQLLSAVSEKLSQ